MRLWCDLSPVEWLIRKMQSIFICRLPRGWSVASWQRRPARGIRDCWETTTASISAGCCWRATGVRFVPEAKVYYRSSGSSSLSYIGNSDKKMVAQLISMDLHIRYIRSLEESPRVRDACVTYLQNWLVFFYPHRPDLVKQGRGNGGEPGWKVAASSVVVEIFMDRGAFWTATSKAGQVVLPRLKWNMIRRWDKTLFEIEGRKIEESFRRI